MIYPAKFVFSHNQIIIKVNSFLLQQFSCGGTYSNPNKSSLLAHGISGRCGKVCVGGRERYSDSGIGLKKSTSIAPRFCVNKDLSAGFHPLDPQPCGVIRTDTGIMQLDTATRSITFQEFADLLETHEAIAPPSMSIIVPVTNSFSSRKIAAAATSSAVPARGIICPDVPF